MKNLTLLFFLLLLSQVILKAQDNNCITPPPNMISWWTGDEDASDIIGFNNGILENGASTETGLVDNAFIFDGIDDKVEINDSESLDLSTGEFSIDFWVMPNSCSVPSSDAIPFITKESETQFDAYVVGIATGEDFIFAGSNNALAFQTVARGGTCIPGEWHFLTITQSNNIAKLYVNGILVSADNTATIPLNTTLPLFFGYREDVSSNSGLQTKYFDGQMDEIEFFDRALTETEILDLYNAGSAGKCKPPYDGPIIDDPVDDDPTDNDPDIIDPVVDDPDVDENNTCSNFICGNNNNKVLICHKGKTICISPNTADAHLSHGDYCGPCNSINQDDESLIYPNPTINTFNLLLDEDIIIENCKIQIKISDLFGKTVLVHNISSAHSKIDVSRFQEGIYIYYISGKNGLIETGRISKE